MDIDDSPVTTIKRLPDSAIRRIQSDQVLSDIKSCLKELVENSIDAGATKIEVKLEDRGLKLIRVKDNGCGIRTEDLSKCAARHYTSKIEDFSGLDSLQTYGFRGEALNSMCASSGEVELITKTKSDAEAIRVIYDKVGKISEKTSDNSIKQTGTSISVKRIFEPQPVRLEHKKKEADKECQHMRQMMVEYCLIHPEIHFVYQQDSKPVEQWNYNTLEDALVDHFGISIKNDLCPVTFEDTNGHYNIQLYLPTEGSEIMFKNVKRCFMYINKRPVDFPAALKMFNKHLRTFFGVVKKNPFIWMNIDIPPDEIDVNFTPDKRLVKLHKQEQILKTLQTLLDSNYVLEPPAPVTILSPVTKSTPPTPNVDTSLDTSMDLYDEPTMDLSEINQSVKKPLFPPAKKDFSDLYIEQDEDMMTSDDIDDISKPIASMPQFKKKSLFDLAKPNSSLKSSSNVSFSKTTNQKKMTDFIDEDQNEFMGEEDKEFRAPIEIDDSDDFKSPITTRSSQSTLKPVKRKKMEDDSPFTTTTSKSPASSPAKPPLTAKVDIAFIKNELSGSKGIYSQLSTKPASHIGGSGTSEDLTAEDISNIFVVGQLENKMYIVKIRNELFALDPYKVKEILLTSKALQELQLKPEPLKEPIRFEEDDLDLECWAIATSSSADYAKYLELNGFQVERIMESSKVIVLLKAMSTEVPGISDNDFIELLRIMAKNRKEKRSETPYCPSVLQYAATEAKKQAQLEVDRDVALDIKQLVMQLFTLQNKLTLSDKCPHSLPLFQKLNCTNKSL